MGSFTVTVVNSGSLDTTLTSPTPLAITGPGAADYTIAPGTTCLGDVLLQPGFSCVVNMTFTPKAVASSSATLSVFHSAIGFPQAYGLLASGTDFTMALGGDTPGAARPSATVTAGGSADFPFFVSVIGSGGLPTTTTFSVSGLPAGAVGTFSSDSIPEGASSTGSVLTVATSAGTIVRGTADGGPAHSPFPFLALLAVFASVLHLGACCGKPCLQRSLAACTLCLAILVCFGLAGCQGGGSSSGGGTSTSSTRVGGTPAGTYTLTITGTAGSVSRSTTVALTVQ
jgi:hypothetical protein